MAGIKFYRHAREGAVRASIAPKRAKHAKNSGRLRTRIKPGRDGRQTFEHALEMRLICKAGFKRDINDFIPAPERMTRTLNAAIDQIGIRRHAIGLFKGPHQMTGRYPDRPANIGKRQRINTMAANEVRRPGHFGIIPRPDIRKPALAIKPVVQVGEKRHKRRFLTQGIDITIAVRS